MKEVNLKVGQCVTMLLSKVKFLCKGSSRSRGGGGGGGGGFWPLIIFS